MKKILIISKLYPKPDRPNLGIFIKREIDSLSESHFIKVIVPIAWKFHNRIDINRNNTCNSVEVIYGKYFPLPGAFFLPVKGIWYFIFLLKIVHSIRKNFNFDIIHAHDVYPEGFCAALLKKIYGKPLIISSRGKDLNELPQRVLLRPMIKFALEHADKIVTVSKNLAEKAYKLGIDQGKVSVMPKGVDMDVFTHRSKIEARKKLGLPLDKIIVLSVGWIIPRKNPLSFTKVLSSYSKVDRDRFLFIWIGEGTLRADLEKEIFANGLKSTIFLAGKKDPDEIAIWMNAANIFMLVSFAEGMPNVLYEAMACGTPVVASNVDGASEVIDNGINGVLLSPDDYNGMARTILRLADDNETRMNLGINARKYIQHNNLSWKNNARWLNDRYAEVLKSFNIVIR